MNEKQRMAAALAFRAMVFPNTISKPTTARCAVCGPLPLSAFTPSALKSGDTRTSRLCERAERKAARRKNRGIPIGDVLV